MNSNFGDYKIPTTLQSLIELQNVLADSEKFYHGFNFYLTLESGVRYFNTPSDVAVFGSLGIDGVHYGFLTDFGLVINLEEAPIVCVCPTDFERPTRIVAKNLREFLRINVSDSMLFYNDFDSEKDYLETREQLDNEDGNSIYQQTKNEKLIQERVTKYLMDKIQIPFIENPYRYVQEVEVERKRNVSINTQDGLGIITPLLQGETHMPFQMNKEVYPDMNLLQEYLYCAPIASRQALLRDIQHYFVLQDHQDLFKIVIDAMLNMKLINEVKRLSVDI